MNIAVLLSGVGLESQNKEVNGNIYSLPDFTQYDGIIIVSDNIYNQTVTGDVIAKIRESKVPCVSLGMKLDDIIYVNLESQSGISAIVEHLAGSKLSSAGRYSGNRL